MAGEAENFMRRLVAALILVVSCSPCLAQNRGGSLKIGAVLPLSGPAAAYGIATRNGIELALADIGPAGKLQVIYEDDRFLVAETVRAFKRLAEIEQVSAVFVIGSTHANALAPL